MRITLFLFAAVAVTQGSTTPSSNREGSLTGHSDNSLLYSLLQAAGFTDSCVSGVLDMCSSAQKEAHFPSLVQNMQEVKVELQKVQAEVQDGKETVQQNVQVVKVELQKVKTEVEEGKQEVQEVKTELHEDMQDLKVEVQRVKEMLQEVMLVVLKNGSLPRHCKDLLDSGDSGSGLRKVFPNPKLPNQPLKVYCEQDIDGGGWTVFQRRVNNSVRQDFYRSWLQYQAGFGDLNGEFWLGLDPLHQLATTEQELRIDLYDYEGQHRWAKYGTFRVGPEDTNYRLTVGRYSGDAGDSMTTYHHGQEFSTYDAYHSEGFFGNCAELHRGAWWYNDCGPANLNGYQYVGDNAPHSKSIFWVGWRGSSYSLMRTTMMIRPAL